MRRLIGRNNEIMCYCIKNKLYDDENGNKYSRRKIKFEKTLKIVYNLLGKMLLFTANLYETTRHVVLARKGLIVSYKSTV